ncbi:nucleoside recognition protein [Aquicoccus porphyridii]|uniref:Nucleoside recognition protein n=1 Tax=Aquicoccus porphyridii TaxID=1852029 RepID=A0A5A9ZL94_9RHOB|nr:nucleoside recognition domain-containing protein [Aquicoccus porphyridii]KAA0917745.1 nucleoside recognition protein [Aquicoccus porphyridii]RAI55816.1 nucleoside recognition protein [Rhodobacteraceae bacterium AsT-22]
MSVFRFAVNKTQETLQIYWELVRIMVPVTIVTEVMSRTGLIDFIAPVLAPVMGLFGLPPELGLAWLTGMLVGIWGAIAMIFTLVPAESMSVADITVFSSLILIAHGLPIEQKIIQKAGPGFAVTTVIRIAGAIVYAMILHHLFAATGWQAETLNPTWIPVADASDWMGFMAGLIEALIYMLAILLTLSWVLEILKLIGLMALLMKILAPTLRLAGIRGETGQFTAVGLFLGISYGGGLLIREARSGNLSPRQVFISCVFMGFAHSIVEDTLLVMALGADVFGVLVGRLVFAITATAVIAHLIRSIPDETFFAWAFRRRRGQATADS